MLSVCLSIIPLYAIIFLGILAWKFSLFSTADARGMNQFVYRFGLSSLLFQQFSRMQPENLSVLVAGGLIVATIFSYVLSFFFQSKIQGQNRSEVVVSTMISTCPNTAYIGLPVVMLLMPGNAEAALLVSFSALLTILVLLIADIQLKVFSRDKRASGGMTGYVVSSLLLNPLFVASLAGFSVSYFSISVPNALSKTVGMLAATGTPCALFCVGVFLAGNARKIAPSMRKKIEKHIYIQSFKFLAQPLITYAVLALLGVSGFPLVVALIAMAMPTALSACVIAGKYRESVEDASLGIVVSTTVFLVSVPFIVLLLKLNQWI